MSIYCTDIACKFSGTLGLLSRSPSIQSVMLMAKMLTRTRPRVLLITLLLSWDIIYPATAQLNPIGVENQCRGEFEGTPFSEHNCQCPSPESLECSVRLGTTPFDEFPSTGKVYNQITRIEFEGSMFTRITAANMQQFPNLEDIEITDGILDTIDSDALTGLFSLIHVILSNNQLTEFPNLSNLQDLAIVDVSHNHITNLNYTQVQGLTNLIQVYIHHNQFRTLKSHTFRDSCNLFYLNASYNQELVEIEEDFFNNTVLRTLDLSHTKIAALPTNGLVRLENLYLEGTEDLKKFPSIYLEEYNADLCTYKTFPFLKLVKATYHAHCCAFEGHKPLVDHEHSIATLQRCQDELFNQPRSAISARNQQPTIVRRSPTDFACINTVTGDTVHDLIPSSNQIFTKAEVCPYLDVCFQHYCPESCDLLSIGSSASGSHLLPDVVCVEKEIFPNSSASILYYISTFLSCATTTIFPSISISPTPIPPTDPPTEPSVEVCDDICDICLSFSCIDDPMCLESYPEHCAAAKRKRSSESEEMDQNRKNMHRHKREQNNTASQLISCSTVFATIFPSDIVDHSSTSTLSIVIASTMCISATPVPSLSNSPTPTPVPSFAPSPTSANTDPSQVPEECDIDCEICLTFSCIGDQYCLDTYPVHCAAARRKRSSESEQEDTDEEDSEQRKRQENRSSTEFMSCFVVPETITPSVQISSSIVTSSMEITGSPTPSSTEYPTGSPSVCVIPMLVGSFYLDDVNDTECFPAEDPFNPCIDVLDTDLLRAAIWIVIILAIGGNSIVIGVTIFYLLLRYKQSGKNPHVMFFFYINLAVADFCMGVYLLTIASIDVSTRGEYSVHAVEWQTGPGCDFAGFFAVVSSMVSIYTLVIITLERTYSIKFALQRKELTKARVLLIVAIGWIAAVVIAILPIFGISSYGSVSICLPFDVRDVFGLTYVVFVMVITGIASLGILVCYVYLFYLVACCAKKRHLYGSLNSREELTLALRMSLLIITDFACWGPIAFFGLTAALGMPLIPIEASKVLMVFVFPLNSCLNPILYSFSTRTFRHNFMMVLNYCGLCKKYGKRVDTSGSYPTTSNEDRRPSNYLLLRRGTEYSLLSWLNSAANSRRGSSISGNSSSSLEDASSSCQPNRVSVSSTQSESSSDLEVNIYPECAIPMRRLREPRPSVCSLSAQVAPMQALPEEVEEDHEQSPRRDNSNRSSHSDGSKELVEFKYNPTYRDSDFEDADLQTDPSLSGYNARHGSPSKVNVEYQETTFFDDAETHKNEYVELPPEVGVFKFSPKHSWAKKLDLDLQGGFGPDEESINYVDPIVSSQDPNVEIQCNTIVFD